MGGNPEFQKRQCSVCGLLLLSGDQQSVLEAASLYGPILRLHRDVDSETAIAGYIGVGVDWLEEDEKSAYLFRCPRCRAAATRHIPVRPRNAHQT